MFSETSSQTFIKRLRKFMLLKALYGTLIFSSSTLYICGITMLQVSFTQTILQKLKYGKLNDVTCSQGIP